MILVRFVRDSNITTHCKLLLQLMNRNLRALLGAPNRGSGCLVGLRALKLSKLDIWVNCLSSFTFFHGRMIFLTVKNEYHSISLGYEHIESCFMPAPHFTPSSSVAKILFHLFSCFALSSFWIKMESSSILKWSEMPKFPQGQETITSLLCIIHHHLDVAWFCLVSVTSSTLQDCTLRGYQLANVSLLARWLFVALRIKTIYILQGWHCWQCSEV